jgi:hypothetical protein
MAKKLAGGRRRKTKKGGYYSFSGAVGTGAPAWSRGSEMSGEVTGRGGNAQMGGKRKRRGGKKTRKVKRGGLRFGQASAGFTGVGTARGLGGYQDVSTPGLGKAAGGEFANHGAQPGSGFGSFIKAA